MTINHIDPALRNLLMWELDEPASLLHQQLDCPDCRTVTCERHEVGEPAEEPVVEEFRDGNPIRSAFWIFAFTVTALMASVAGISGHDRLAFGMVVGFTALVTIDVIHRRLA